MTQMTSHLEGCNWQGMLFRKPHLWGCDRQIMEAKCMINSSHTREVFRWMRGKILCRGMQTAEIHNNCPHPRKPPFLKSFFTKGTVISGMVFYTRQMSACASIMYVNDTMIDRICFNPFWSAPYYRLFIIMCILSICSFTKYVFIPSSLDLDTELSCILTALMFKSDSKYRLFMEQIFQIMCWQFGSSCW